MIQVNLAKPASNKRQKSENIWWLCCGLMAGVSSLSFALGSVPSRGTVTDDTALYQSLSEIRVQKQRDLNFDSDIARLSALEDNYYEKLPNLADHPRLKGPMKRISNSNYKYRGSKRSRTVRR